MPLSIFNDFESQPAARDKENACPSGTGSFQSRDKVSAAPSRGTGGERRSRRVVVTKRVPGYNPDILQYNGEVTSFEEYRAMKYEEKKLWSAVPAAPSRDGLRMRTPVRPRSSAAPFPAPALAPAPAAATPKERAKGAARPVEPLFPTASPFSAPNTASPTIHTREAMSDVMAMFRDEPSGDDAGADAFGDGGAGTADPSCDTFSIFQDPDPAEDAKVASAAPSPAAKSLAPIMETSQEGNVSVSFSVSSLSSASPAVTNRGEGGATARAFDDKAKAAFAAKQDFKASSGRFYDYSGSEPEFEISDVRSGEETMVDIGDLTFNIERSMAAPSAPDHYHFAVLDIGEDDAYFELHLNAPTASLWEFYMSEKLKRSLGARGESTHDLVLADSAYRYRGMSATLFRFVTKDSVNHTLSDVASAYAFLNKRMDEKLAMYYAVEMLRIVEKVHACGLIHMNVRAESFALIDGPASVRLGPWNAALAGGWDKRGLALMGFQDAIDTAMHPAGTRFKCEAKTPRVAEPCLEVRMGRAFLREQDYYGICATVHALLHGTALTTQNQQAEDGQWVLMPTEKVPDRYQTAMWNRMFRALLNAKNSRALSLKAIRAEFETYLAKSDRADKLAYCLMKQKSDMSTYMATRDEA